MGKNEIVDELIQCISGNNSKINRIEVSYRDYLETGNADSLNVFLQSICDFSSPDVYKILNNTYCYSKENYEDVLQIGSTYAWKVIVADKETGYPREKIVAYFRGIYQKKALDFVRNTVNCRVRTPGVSIEEMLGDEDVPIDILPPTISAESEYEIEERKEVYWGIFTIYCEKLIEDYKIPQRNFALFYSKILYHLEESNDLRYSSSKWAIERMGIKNVGQLKKESEHILVHSVNKKLKWTDEFVDAIKRPCREADEFEPFVNIIYTRVFTKDRIDNLTESMHNVLVKAINRELCNDSDKSKRMISYVENMPKISKLFGERK